METNCSSLTYTPADRLQNPRVFTLDSLRQHLEQTLARARVGAVPPFNTSGIITSNALRLYDAVQATRV